MEFIYENNRIYLNNEAGEMVAEITFPSVSDDKVDINHTFVDDSLRGQGIAGKLMTAVCKKLKAENKQAIATCSFAARWFERHTEYSDIL